MPQQSLREEPSHPSHQQTADFREVVKHRFNFGIRITPTDFWDNLTNKQVWNGADDEEQGVKHSAGLKESDFFIWFVSCSQNLSNLLSPWTVYPVFLSFLEMYA